MVESTSEKLKDTERTPSMFASLLVFGAIIGLN